MHQHLKAIHGVVLAVIVFLLSGSQDIAAQVDKATLWQDATATELDVDFGGTGFHARWKFKRCDCGDLSVQVEQIAPDDVLTGELLMVDGKVLLSQGFTQQGDDIEPLIQAPSLMLQLAYAMLSHSQPGGPFAVDGKQQWNKTEKNEDFKLDTGLATGVFAAPWGVKGTGWKTASGHYRFELLFHFNNSLPGEAEQTDSMTLSGDLDFSQQVFPYAASTDLGGWRVQWISLNDRESEAVPAGLTLQELREQAKNPSGTP